MIRLLLQFSQQFIANNLKIKSCTGCFYMFLHIWPVFALPFLYHRRSKKDKQLLPRATSTNSFKKSNFPRQFATFRVFPAGLQVNHVVTALDDDMRTKQIRNLKLSLIIKWPTQFVCRTSNWANNVTCLIERVNVILIYNMYSMWVLFWRIVWPWADCGITCERLLHLSIIEADRFYNEFEAIVLSIATLTLIMSSSCLRFLFVILVRPNGHVFWTVKANRQSGRECLLVFIDTLCKNG